MLDVLPSATEMPIVLLINVLGAFLLGVVFALADEAGLMRAQTRFFLAVGVLGGFTTFSTFGWGVDVLLAQGAIGGAFAYLLASIGGGAMAVVAGLATGRELVALLERAALNVLRADDRGMRPGRSSNVELRATTTEDPEVSA
jgi:CrcB protein